MAARALGDVRELVRQVSSGGERAGKLELAMLVGKTADGSLCNREEEPTDASSALRRCRPANVADYMNRLRSFRTPWWFNMPSGISPIECAKKGWVNVGQDTIECLCCGAQLVVERTTAVAGCSSWILNGSEVQMEKGDVEAWKGSLCDQHSLFCPWRSQECSRSDPEQMPDADVVATISTNLRELRGLSHCPKLSSDGSQAADRNADLLESLACAGWTFVGRVDAPASASPASSTAQSRIEAEVLALSDSEQLHEFMKLPSLDFEPVAEKAGDEKAAVSSTGKLEILQCVFCLRAVAVQSFTHTPVALDEAGAGARQEDEPEGSPPAKRRRCDELPPWRGLWTPTHRSHGGVAADAKVGSVFDQHALHRFYCPMYSRPDDELGSTASRVTRCWYLTRGSSRTLLAKGTAVAKTNGDDKDARDDQAENMDESGSRAAEAVARAEHLLQRLNNVLPRA